MTEAFYNFEVLIRNRTDGRTMYLPVVARDEDMARHMVLGALGDDPDFPWRLDVSGEALNKGQVACG